MCVHTGITEIWEWVSHGSRLDGDGVGERCSKLLVRIAYGFSFFFSSRYQKFCRCLDRPGWSRQSQPRCSRRRPRACGFCVVRMARSFSGEVGAGPYILCIYIHSDPLLLSFFLFLLFLYLLTKILLFFPFYFVPTFYVVACLLQLIPPPSFLPAANRLRERARGGIS